MAKQKADKLAKVKTALRKNKEHRKIDEMLDTVSINADDENNVLDDLLDCADELSIVQLDRLNEILEKRGLI